MEENRRASQQVAYRVEPEVYKPWDEYVEAGLIPGRCHHACAMLLYLWVRPEIRESMQDAFAKFVRENVLECPPVITQELSALSDEEKELLQVFRAAPQRIRKKAALDLRAARE
jgi:hypothetical protein